jgi:hypothetical protein
MESLNFQITPILYFKNIWLTIIRRKEQTQSISEIIKEEKFKE